MNIWLKASESNNIIALKCREPKLNARIFARFKNVKFKSMNDEETV